MVTANQNERLAYPKVITTFKIDYLQMLPNWIDSFKKNTDICNINNSTMAKKLTKKPDPALEKLKADLQMAEMKIKALNTLIDVGEEQFKINIREKSGNKQSPK